MIIKKQIKLIPRKIAAWMAAVIIFLTIIILILVSIFLYKNFYQAIVQTKEILILREKVALDAVNLEKFNLIIEKLTKKTAAKELNNVTDPFR